MSTKEISEAAQALGRRGGLKSLGAKTKAELSAFGKAAAQKRWAAFGRGEQSGEKNAVGGMFTAAAQQVDRNARLEASHRECAEALGIAKPKRPLPKAGTVNAHVLEMLRIFGAPQTLEQVSRAIGKDARNALSSLRSGGHVVSEPKPGSRREKLWRLA